MADKLNGQNLIIEILIGAEEFAGKHTSKKNI